MRPKSLTNTDKPHLPPQRRTLICFWLSHVVPSLSLSFYRVFGQIAHVALYHLFHGTERVKSNLLKAGGHDLCVDVRGHFMRVRMFVRSASILVQMSKLAQCSGTFTTVLQVSSQKKERSCAFRKSATPAHADERDMIKVGGTNPCLA